MHYAPNHRRFVSRRSALALLAGTSCGLFGLGSLGAASPLPKHKPSWADAQQIVARSLVYGPQYRPGDLISRGDAQRALDHLKVAGWQAPDQNKLLAKVLDDGHFLVRELRTPAGLAFSRAVANQSNSFDRLDRLSQQPGGQKLVHSIIRLPDGVKLMSPKPTPGFGDLTELLPKQANGRTPKVPDFNKPTGKIYTESQLLAELKKAWDASQATPVSVPGR
jgi:hypothetical protein